MDGTDGGYAEPEVSEGVIRVLGCIGRPASAAAHWGVPQRLSTPRQGLEVGTTVQMMRLMALMRIWVCDGDASLVGVMLDRQSRATCSHGK